MTRLDSTWLLTRVDCGVFLTHVKYLTLQYFLHMCLQHSLCVGNWLLSTNSGRFSFIKWCWQRFLTAGAKRVRQGSTLTRLRFLRLITWHIAQTESIGSTAETILGIKHQSRSLTISNAGRNMSPAPQGCRTGSWRKYVCCVIQFWCPLGEAEYFSPNTFEYVSRFADLAQDAWMCTVGMLVACRMHVRSCVRDLMTAWNV